MVGSRENKTKQNPSHEFIYTEVIIMAKIKR